MDTVDKKTRSRIMASVGQRNTGPELRLRKALHRLGFRYRLNERNLPGSPDLVFPKYRAVIFVHGCYWHSHGCKYSTIPSTRKEFWLNKFEANKKRDKRKIDSLLELCWRVLVVWECAMKFKKKDEFDELIGQVTEWLHSSRNYDEIPYKTI
jgi:DNA mismatch endonuclease, patch repair protein